MNGWMAYDLCPFYSISVISEQWDGDNESLCAMEPSYRLESFPPAAGFEPGTARAAGQRFTYWATGLRKVYEAYVHTGSNLTALQWLYNLIPKNQSRNSFTTCIIIFSNSLMGFKVI